MLKPFIFENKCLGEYFEDDRVFCFFGNKSLNLEQIKSHFPGFNFCEIKQVHGNDFIKQPANNLVEADGHFANEKNTALLIQTADCIPVMLETKHHIAALHCGWRSVESKLAVNAQQILDEPVLRAWIGPHISKKSFEVGVDVAERLCDASNINNKALISLEHKEQHKRYIDLTAILKSQLSCEQVYTSSVNTFDDLVWNSYRRDGSSAGRNYSFVSFK